MYISSRNFYSLKQTLDKSVSKSEGSGGKAVEDRGVDLCVVLGAQAVGQGKDI